MLFNHVLTYKGDLATLTNELYSAVMKIVEHLPTVTDTEAVSALLLAATRSLYKNQALMDRLDGNKDKFGGSLRDFALKQQSAEVKGAVADLVSLLGE